jgi:hypothetical protein
MDYVENCVEVNAKETNLAQGEYDMCTAIQENLLIVIVSNCFSSASSLVLK